MGTKRWSEISRGGRAGIVALAAVQLSLAASAWADLATRPADRVRGSKAAWAAIIAVNFVGPILYFTRGRTSGRS